MVELIYANENEPFPNNSLPILLYKNDLKENFEGSYSSEDVLNLLENNGYSNGWTGGILKEHHFHSNTHEVLACIQGKAKVQLGGPDGDVFDIRENDVLLLPAGVAHKKVDGSRDFQIVGAYPDGIEFDMQKGNASDYEKIRGSVSNVAIPKTDPLSGTPGAIGEHWQ